MSDFITPEQVARLRQLRDAAPALPWVVESYDDDNWKVCGTRDGAFFFLQPTVFDDGSAGGEYGPTCSEASRDYILAAAHMAPALADEVERLRAENESLLRIINDSFLSLHSPYSTLAFDGRNLTPHVGEASRAAAILHGELGEARREVKRLREDINVKALNEDCWALIRAVGLPDHARPTSCHRVVVDEIIPAIERLRRERDEFLEGIHVMLKLCGGSEDIDALERQVKECGTKPSMFVAERIALAKKLLDSIAVVELAWERGEDWRDQRLAVWAMSGLADDLRQKLTQPLPGERRDTAKEPGHD